ncbi:MAG: hypothetical protein JST47_02200 [Bacteroidetes bacterium]|nr:hypothetical protein [Bacteroidota bacterium]MBS1973432.1 hypothetical protein [Bacteroidota bacterium]
MKLIAQHDSHYLNRWAVKINLLLVATQKQKTRLANVALAHCGSLLPVNGKRREKIKLPVIVHAKHWQLMLWAIAGDTGWSYHRLSCRFNEEGQ